MIIRDEEKSDEAAIRSVTTGAFASVAVSQKTEAAIIEALRADHALSVSLVAVEDDQVIGHIAFSPITINGPTIGNWYGVGPLSVRPDRQRTGVGSALMMAGIERLLALGASSGCVLVGDPAYYYRFGFKAGTSLVLPNVPPEYFQVLPLKQNIPVGQVAFHPAFKTQV